MSNHNLIGLNQDGVSKLTGLLNKLLANYQILYMNVRGFHWNVRGDNFFELHAKFEETYNELLLKVDEIAERILTLSERPLHSFSSYIERASINEERDITDGKKGISHLLDSYQQLIKEQREILELAGEVGDEGTSSLMSDYIKEQEKTVWMLGAYLNR
ncbi:Dps family protein [Gallaecimonas pentaromativorans]|uniref:Starvation-inducible DNA-binding protein n=1 Tax=Gallaecimonas pentaromativorans TaxID=584787 RepID=A0A3N1NKE2_9GAMM|nr:Dps family protein [Gallaecimonas pentaromativorans]MED5526193.1 Dps family protein [Pseudomonadota bacterium]ROQ19212.1 starvation-inducible DNA-binding protein [Gallaecimonas pentaromativorans]